MQIALVVLTFLIYPCCPLLSRCGHCQHFIPKFAKFADRLSLYSGGSTSTTVFDSIDNSNSNSNNANYMNSSTGTVTSGTDKTSNANTQSITAAATTTTTAHIRGALTSKPPTTIPNIITHRFDVVFGTVNCVAHRSLCEAKKVDFYPTILVKNVPSDKDTMKGHGKLLHGDLGALER
jgi:hypothetical protein